jgi:transcriptional antiterminator RfaH
MKRWYAVYTHPRKEELAREHLARQGFQVFFPRYLKRRSHARRIETVPAPLFPRYLFVAFDIDEAGWQVIRSTRGVVDLVRKGSDPAFVPASVIDAIRNHEGGDGFVLLASHLKLDRGDKIRISSPAFAACEAIFEARRDEERIVALLSGTVAIRGATGTDS